MSITLEQLLNAEIPDSTVTKIQEQIKILKQKYPVITTTERINESNGNSMLDNLKDSEVKLREALIDAFPNIDADRFIDTFLKYPIFTGTINLAFYQKVFELLNHSYIYGYSDMPASISIRTSNEKANILRIKPESFKDLIKEFSSITVSLILGLAITSFTSDTEELKNHIEINTNEINKQLDTYTIFVNEKHNDLKVKHDSDMAELQRQLDKIIENQEKIIKESEENKN